MLLLVEDNEELCAILKETLEATYEVHVTHNGKDGWEKAQEIQPELVITDLIIPEMSGKELCYKIKITLNWPRYPSFSSQLRCLPNR